MELKDTVIITFSGPEHDSLANEFHRLYGHLFLDSVKYTTEWIKETEFYKTNQQLFKYKKYFGYFLWKPYIILHALDKYPNSNILYCDTNLRFKDFNKFAKAYNYGVNTQGVFFVVHEHYLNADWTKRDCFILMDADEPRYYYSKQMWTSLMGFRNVGETLILLSDYINYCLDPRIVTEEPNTLGENLPSFREHRWDQSVMSILMERYNIKGISDTVFMQWVDKLYPKEIMKLKQQLDTNPLQTEHE